MHTRRLGCISNTGILAALFSLLVVLGVSLARGGVLFIPGGLNNQGSGQSLGGVTTHAELGGRCVSCHPPPWSSQSMSNRCLACHTDLVDDPQNFHRVMIAESRRTDCVSCHTDHHGAEASLTIDGLQEFPHRVVGFSLQAHQRKADGVAFACSDCHGEKVASFDQGTCERCHQEINSGQMQAHILDFDRDCLACHDGIDSYGHDFDHNSLPFPLTGAHAFLICKQCHTQARTIADLRATSWDCYACHAGQDIHNGTFGSDCASCHTPESWQGASFDHSASAFPLTGAHVTLACERCHIDHRFAGTPQDCYACHASQDAHNGAYGFDCVGCHTTVSWQEASFDHNLSAFPLTGAHVQVACLQCHVNQVYAGTPQACAACHQDPEYHAGLFAEQCQDCHDTLAWSPARYSGQHTFPLNHGGDRENTCRTCHPASLQTYSCYECHEHDPAEIASKHREHGIGGFEDCIRCHATGHKEEGEGEGGED